MNQNFNRTEKKQIIALVILLIIASFALSIAHSRQQDLGKTMVEGITNINLTRVTQSDQPAFKDFGQLNIHGVSDDQLTGVRYSLSKFYRSVNGVGEVSLDTKSVKTQVKQVGSDYSSLDLSFYINRTKYNCTVSYSGLSAVSTIVNGLTGTQLYNSGDIDINTNPPQ